jgi:hypothetical protein
MFRHAILAISFWVICSGLSLSSADAAGGNGGPSLNCSSAGLGAGGSGFSGANGGNGGFGGYVCTGPGGGGGAAGGGSGGAGGDAQDNDGSAAGGAGGAAGGPGSAGSTDNVIGSGGGGGGGGTNAITTSTLNNLSPLQGEDGGAGGTGGDGGIFGGSGGGGGAGGYGAVVTGAGASSNSSSITGGTGGDGGVSGSGGADGGYGGSGGDGGVGVVFTATGAIFTNSGAITGGNGGAGGSGYSPAANGAGGAGIVGSGLTIINSGSITGGLDGSHSVQADAIEFTDTSALASTLEITSTSSISGNVVDTGGTYNFVLGGTTKGSFDTSLIGTQYQNVGNFQLNAGNATTVWTLTGSSAYTGPVEITQGILNVTAGTLNSASALTFDGGTLQAGADNLVFGNSVAIDNAGGTIDANGNVLSLTGGITNGNGSTGTLDIISTTGGGVVILKGTNTYSGPTVIGDGTNAAALEGGATNAFSPNSAVTINANSYLDLGPYTQTIGSLAGSGTVNSSGGGTGTLVTGGDNSSTTFSGVIQNGGGTTALTKQGSGTFTLSGTNTYSGATTVSEGKLEIADGGSIEDSASLTNEATFYVDAGGSATFGSVTNDGTITNYGTITDSLDNTNTLNNFGTYNVTTLLTNSGTLNMVNGVAGNTINVTGNYVASGAATLDVDAGLHAGGTADQLTVTGSVSGTTTVNVNRVGSVGYFAAPIPVVTTGSGGPSDAFVAGDGFQSAGIVDYGLKQIGDNYDIYSYLDPTSAPTFVTGIVSALDSLNIGFFQDASPFLPAPANAKPNQLCGGPWVRVADGRNDIGSNATTPDGLGGDNTAHSLVRSQYSGVQAGFDAGVCNVQNSDYNAHLGITGGKADLTSNELDLASSTIGVQVPFVGLYGAVTGHGLHADFQVREDFYLMQASSPTADVFGDNLHGHDISANGSVGYTYYFTKDVFIEPSLALLYSDLNIGNLALPSSGGVLAFDPIASLLGHAGLRLGTSFIWNRIAVEPFVSGAVWREFEGDAVASYEQSGVNMPISVTRLGTFGQVGLGASAHVLNTGLLGFIRGDYRDGQNIQGYGVTAGLRYDF